jgi:hypothetical protein
VVFIEGADLLVEDPCKSQIVMPFVVGLRRIAEHYSLAIILSVGAPKSRPQDQYALKRDQVFGSQAWARMADTVLVLNITGDGTDATRDLVVLHRNAAAGSPFFRRQWVRCAPRRDSRAKLRRQLLSSRCCSRRAGRVSGICWPVRAARS